MNINRSTYYKGHAVTGSDVVAADSPAFSRRSFLMLGAGSLLFISGCTLTPNKEQTDPIARPKTIDALLATKPFYIAHRGSGDNWVEHTMSSYTESTKAGAPAIEVSVRATSDGVLVCHHDANLKRTTGVDRVIAEATWSEISEIPNNATAWLGPDCPEQPIPLVKDVLDKFAPDGIIFIEDKDGSNTKQLLELMDSYPDSKSHFVWKQWAASETRQMAADKGYKTWGYFTVDIIPRARKLAEGFDFLGVNSVFTETQVKEIVAFGKPVICWEVHFRSQRTHLEQLGVVGMMCSNYPYVTSSAAISQTDSFGTGLRAAGDLPWKADAGWEYQPRINADAGSITMSEPTLGYLLGSMSPVEKPAHRLSVEMRWPREVPGKEHLAGLAFGVDGDNTYVIGTPSQSSGYHVILRGNGSFELYARAAGASSGTLLGQVQTDPPLAGQWIRLNIAVDSNKITVAREINITWTISVDEVGNQSGYMWLLKNYTAGPELEFRNVAVLDELS